MANCTRCKKKLGMIERVGDDLCKSCEGEILEERRRAQELYREVASKLASGALSSKDAAATLDAPGMKLLDARELATIHRETIDALADRVLADDILTQDEDDEFCAAIGAMGVSQADLASEFRPILYRLVIAQVNDGRLPEVPDPTVMLKKGELAHLEVGAALLKEVSIREYRAGYGGLSFKVAKGVRFHTGRVRGKSVVVGTQIQVEDEGRLSVTSKRAVFLGSRKTMDMPYSKLVGLNVFSDGIQFHLSNRQRAPMLRVDSGEFVAAVVNAAAQRLE